MNEWICGNKVASVNCPNQSNNDIAFFMCKHFLTDQPRLLGNRFFLGSFILFAAFIFRYFLRLVRTKTVLKRSQEEHFYMTNIREIFILSIPSSTNSSLLKVNHTFSHNSNSKMILQKSVIHCFVTCISCLQSNIDLSEILSFSRKHAWALPISNTSSTRKVVPSNNRVCCYSQHRNHY